MVELSGTTQKIKSFDGQNGQVLSIEIHDAKLGFVQTGQQSPQPQQSPLQLYRAPQQATQQAQPQYNEPPIAYSDDIPFAPVGLMHSNNLMHCI